MLDVLAIGEVLVDIVADGPPGGYSWSFSAHPGGAPANVAVGVARLGGRAGFLGAVSSDAFGQWLVSILEREGVDQAWCPTYNQPTTLAFVTLDEQGERSFSFYREATSDTALRPEDVTPASIDSARAVHVCSVSLSQQPARDATKLAIARAKEAGRFISFDVNLRPALWTNLKEAQEQTLDVMEQADLIKLSGEELQFLRPDGDFERLISEVDPERRKLWVVTAGGAATRYACGDMRGAIKPFSVRAVDTTGAGDAFVAALLVHLAQHDFQIPTQAVLEAGIRFAHAAAACCVQKLGAIPALPTLQETTQLLELVQ